MKPRHVFLSLALLVLAVAGTAQIPPPRIPPKVPPRPIPLPTGPDPAVVRFEFSIVSRSAPTRGTVQITAVIKNVGSSDYVSGPNQQNISLSELPLGGTAAVRKTCQFPTEGSNAVLRVNQETRCSWTRAWNSSSPAEGEFPPNYKAMIVYDPDIRLDSNPKNDDVNAANNTLQDSGAKINALFH